MHYHCEIIMPATDDVEGQIAKIMKQFEECGEDEDGNPNRYTLWDWYVIGGRFAGEKQRVQFDADRLQKFVDALNEKKVTVSAVQAGKQALQPASQIPMVDQLWQEHFPESEIKVCPLFAHYNDQYKHSDGYPDIMSLKDMPEKLTASTVIIAGLNYQGDIAAQYLIQDSMYNGVCFVDTEWDGTVKGALAMYAKRLKNYKEEAREKYTPKDDWLVVTVDYHS